MARTIPNSEPTILVAGDSWSWNKILSTYPPSEGWVLAYSVRGASALPDAKITVTPNVGTGVYAVTALPADTAGLISGAYYWQSYVTGTGAYAGQRYTVDTGVFTIVRALSSVPDNSAQAHAEKMVGLLTLAIEGRVPADFEHYTIGNRQIQKIPILTLMRLRGIYQSKLYRLMNPGSLGPQVVAQMNSPDGTIGVAAPVVLPPWYRQLSQ